jgi:ABC-2 type transport system ATP-binding protein
MAMDENAVIVDGLVKRYGNNMAVDGISFEVKKGEVFGLLGPNGAGKTTTLECLEGMRAADQGSLTVAGCDPQKDGRALRQKLGVQLQASSLPDCIHVDEAMALVCSWHGLQGRDDLLGQFGLAPLRKKQYHALSTGQKRRLHLALALATDPAVVILDEPTAGLDVQGRAELHEAVRSLKASGMTVLLATHDMAEAETLCDRIAILINGRVAVCGTPTQVTAAGDTETRVRIRTANNSLMPRCEIEGARFIKAEEGYCSWVCGDISVSVMDLLQRVKSAGDTVEDMRVERPSLEERFMELVEGVKA